ncbi:hypothetical protein LPUS_01265 [Lasallia pustulata]|uniref:Uncharacterized protein n=1 Tax=Lasallia pustulata TaxID=136370 RepID=A0A1W5D9R4_9LECA|nr:hypothetical protein LPUS_01265 [Lasallia pustulata]
MAKDCWAMEGYIVDADRPCNPEADESACCRVGENCIGSGFCFSTRGYLYQGSCTDNSWKASECPAVCPTGYNNTIIPCNIVNFDQWGTFACSCSAQQWPECCLRNFTIPAGFGEISHLVLNVTGNATGSSTSSSTSSQVPATATLASKSTIATPAAASTAANSPTASSHVATSKTYSKSTTIIAAVGAPLGVLLMAVVLYFFLLERRQRRRLEQQVAALSIPSSPTRHQISPPLLREQFRRSERPELPGDRGLELPVDRQTPELY